MAELRQLGGALGRPHEGGGVLSHLDAEFVMFAGAMAWTPEIRRRWGTPTRSASPRRWRRSRNGRQYLNFAENPVDPPPATPSGPGASSPASAARSTPTASSWPTTRCRGFENGPPTD